MGGNTLVHAFYIHTKPLQSEGWNPKTFVLCAFLHIKIYILFKLIIHYSQLKISQVPVSNLRGYKDIYIYAKLQIRFYFLIYCLFFSYCFKKAKKIMTRGVKNNFDWLEGG